MALELITVEAHAIFTAINYMSHLFLHFAFYWTDNRK